VSESFDLTTLENFVAGTVGEPGERTFYLQGHDDATLVSLKVEKGQVQALASGIADAVADLDNVDLEPPADMTEPVITAWTVGMLGIGIDKDNDRLVVLANEIQDDDSEPSTARFHLTFPQARGFAEHALFLVEYGRDFGRQNGHRPL